MNRLIWKYLFSASRLFYFYFSTISLSWFGSFRKFSGSILIRFSPFNNLNLFFLDRSVFISILITNLFLNLRLFYLFSWFELILSLFNCPWFLYFYFVFPSRFLSFHFITFFSQIFIVFFRGFRLLNNSLACCQMNKKILIGYCFHTFLTLFGSRFTSF